MKSGQCPKCESQEVHSVATIRNDFVVPLGIMSVVGSATKLYVCVRCGYVEIYVLDNTDLPKIAAKWPRVTPADQADIALEGRT
jgi:predicted nucleic-acid-binding Zn-ribbon protein